MREDPTKSETFANSEIWGNQKYNEDFLVSPDQFNFDQDDPRKNKKFVSNSLSGRERNRMFMKTLNNFSDVSLVSGTDNLSDARSFALLDFNNDGWTDIALMSLNAPRFNLYQNEFGKLYPDRQSLRIRLEGGLQSNKPNDSLSNRDGIGARVIVEFKTRRKIMLHKQAGEGFGSQNSSVLRVGVRAGDSVSKIQVLWPSGKTQTVQSPNIASIVTIKESE